MACTGRAASNLTDHRVRTKYLKAFWVDFPQQALDFLLYLPPPVHGEGEDDGHEEECAQDARSDLGPAAGPLALGPIITAVRLIHGPELVRPVDVQSRDVRDRARGGGCSGCGIPSLIRALIPCGGICIIVEISNFDEEVPTLELDLARDAALVRIFVLFQRECGEVPLRVAVVVNVDGIARDTFVIALIYDGLCYPLPVSRKPDGAKWEKQFDRKYHPSSIINTSKVNIIFKWHNGITRVRRPF